MISIDLSDVKPVEVQIDLAGGSFSIFLEPPTFDEVRHDAGQFHAICVDPSELHAANCKARDMRRLLRVVNWSGINTPSGVPIPFSIDSLKKLLARSPAASNQVGNAIDRLYLPDDKSLGELGARQDPAQPAADSLEPPPTLSPTTATVADSKPLPTPSAAPSTPS